MADVLAFYGANRASDLAHPELVGYHLGHLLKHFGESTCWDINTEPAGLTLVAAWPVSLVDR